jgi:four helix bundle protein
MSKLNPVGYEKLIVWQIADEFAWKVYELTNSFPKDEVYGLTSQLRRAVLSIVLNIVEGHSRFNKNEFRNFLRISLGSLAETDYLLRFALRRKYLSQRDYLEVTDTREKVGKLLWNLMKSQK